MEITTIGVDLAKLVFQVHGVNRQGQTVLRKQLKRAAVRTFFANLPPCLVGMEACAGAHYWARTLAQYGHTVRLIAPQFVKPYLKSNKNDALDAEAICEAVTRPHMRFVPAKTLEQQAVLSLHRARQGLVKARTAQANQIRGLLSEFGIVMPVGLRRLGQALPAHLAEANDALPETVRDLVARLAAHLQKIDREVQDLERQIVRWHRQSEPSRRLAHIPGIGPITASALVASVGDAKAFHDSRQFAAWLGLVPRQHSSGGKTLLLGISKRGDAYLRTLLIHGARAVLKQCERRIEATTGWLQRLLRRRHPNVAAVALANKNARVVWALLARGTSFQSDYRPAPGGP